MEAYLRAFVNWEENDWVWLLLMAKFAYNNSKNASTGHTPFELNCGYHPRMLYKEKVDLRSQSKSAGELSEELRQLMVVYCENLHHAQELQKRAYDKGVEPQSYAPGEKIWLNSKFIKTRRNRKLEAKFFGPFQVLHPVKKQAYKLELPKNGEFMMLSMCHCWSRTPQGRDGSSQCQNLSRATKRSTRWKLSETVQSIPRKKTDTF